jgi:sugar O-acyltransferase (sialic acid O-acetyltransferase NeuD family)
MQILIYGSKDFAQTVNELARHCGHQVVGMVDDFRTGDGIVGNLISVTNDFPAKNYGFAIAIGYSNLQARWQAWKKIRSLGYRAPALIHPRAYLADSVNVSDGSMIMAGSNLDVRVNVGELAVIWPGACISHDSTVGSNSFVSPNATLCGHVNLGSNCFVGAGAAIADHCDVPPNTFIKMLGRYKQESK